MQEISPEVFNLLYHRALHKAILSATIFAKIMGILGGGLAKL